MFSLIESVFCETLNIELLLEIGLDYNYDASSVDWYFSLINTLVSVYFNVTHVYFPLGHLNCKIDKIFALFSSQ